jgi:hypothetical protein
VAVGRPHNRPSIRQITRLSQSTGGPIVIGGKGRQPRVDRRKLLDWWNNLEERNCESENRLVDSRATVAEQFDYGKAATVVPQISGSVKRTRRNSRKS